MMTKTLAMFPGQGSQYVGMASELLDNFRYTSEIFEEVEDALSVPIRRLCLEGPEDELTLTENTQPAILTVSVATWEVLKREIEFKADYYAGHSLGEYSALVASGKLELADAAKLVKERGRQMQLAVPSGRGAMLAVLNYPFEDLKTLMDSVTQRMLSGEYSDLTEGLSSEDLKMASSLDLANFNSEKQLIVSGGKQAVDVLESLLVEKKVKAVSLAVSAPFHSSLMVPAKESLRDQILALTLKDETANIIANVDGKLAAPYSLNLLVDQIDGSVLWAQTLSEAAELGVKKLVEVGPGRVLFGLARRAVAKDVSLTHTDQVRAALETLKN